MSEVVFAHPLCGKCDKAECLALACLVMTGKVHINNLQLQLHIKTNAASLWLHCRIAVAHCSKDAHISLPVTSQAQDLYKGFTRAIQAVTLPN